MSDGWDQFQYQPDIHLNDVLLDGSTTQSPPQQWATSPEHSTTVSQGTGADIAPSQASSPPIPGAEADEDDLRHIDLEQQFQKMRIEPMKDRFFGPSSGFMFVAEAIKARQVSLGAEDYGALKSHNPRCWAMQPVSLLMVMILRVCLKPF
jgi:hypothetical protein